MAADGMQLRRAAAMAARQDGVLTRRQVEKSGVSDALLRLLLRARSWEVLLRGTYLLEVERDDDERRRPWSRAAVMSAPGSAVSHHSAAVLRGVEGVPRTGRVHLTRPMSTADRPGLRVHESPLPPGDVDDLDGIPVTSVVRTLSDLVLQLDERDALVVLDSALFRGVASPAVVVAAHDRAAGRRGYRRSQRSWGLADAGAESPLESRARWDCLTHGLRPMAPQLKVRDDAGILVARSDLAFDRNQPPVSGREAIAATGTLAGRSCGLLLPLLCEADGKGPHGRPEVLGYDRHRQNGLVRLRYPIMRVMWDDTRVRGRVAQMVSASLAA